jgi:perosamine synthetase
MSTFDVQPLIGALTDVLGPPGAGVALHEPRFAGREWILVKDCLDSGWVSSVGAYVDRFESMIAQACGASHAVATVNGTAALHTSLLLLGVCPGDEVIVPALTFVATANAVSYCHATPHFADVDAATLGLDPVKLRRHLEHIGQMQAGTLINRETGRPIRCVVPMHTFGHPVAMDELMTLAAEFGLALLEDATESLGSTYKGKPTGAIARLGALSFNGNKTVTTGGGGAIVMNDQALWQEAKHLTTTAKLRHPWAFVHDRIGFNYRLPNINAALGVAQMEQLKETVEAKRNLAAAYARRLAGFEGLTFVHEHPGMRANYWLNAVLLNTADPALRDSVLAATNAIGFMTRPIWTAMHRLPIYSQCPRDDLAVTEDLEARLINLPSSAKHGFALANGVTAT